MTRRSIISAALALVWTGAALSAQTSDLTVLDTREATKGWEAVGRLDIDGAGFCTATLVRDDLILTAAHCVYDRDAALIDAERFVFQSGLRDGRAHATRRIVRILPHPDYAQNSAEWTQTRVASDLAVLALDQPIRFAGVEAMPLSPDAYPGDQVAIVSYGGSRADFPSLQSNCKLMDKANGILVMNCAAERGTSGAPVVRLANGRARVVGVVAAIADMGSDPISLAVPIQSQLQALTEMMQTLSDGARDTTETSRRDTGAKFIRP